MQPGRPCQGLLLPLGTGAPKGLVCGGEEPALTLPRAMPRELLRSLVWKMEAPLGWKMLEDAMW